MKTNETQPVATVATPAVHRALDLPPEVRASAEARAAELGMDFETYVAALIRMDKAHNVVSAPEA